ncbi:LANO_0H18954g1_1 [Lachancea nothofagi CBS 11611]|uniref:Acireductone dioxygenase n=1 Tax=Lachancea nothofagi CBS 11611 TaxID=1266666 RepID=A0A1G4KNA9_9SACH|nr:LANO_0H18954g1_1 [Lachancea nothofagi CBS 11611]
MVEAYYHDNDESVDFREPHNSGETVSIDQLANIGVIYKPCPTEAQMNDVAIERNYRNRDRVSISSESLGDALWPKLQAFYAEHLHEDEEIRYIEDGEGYFDVRNAVDDRWIRCKLVPGDLLILPAGIYHRFTLTTQNYVKAVRLFKDEPKWVAHGRPIADKFSIREEYLASIH